MISKSQISSFKSGKGETLGMIHTGETFLFICGLVKLENKLDAFKIQWWGRHRTAVVDAPFEKDENRRKEGAISSKQFWNPTRQTPLGLKA